MRNWHEVRYTPSSIVDSFGVPAIHVNVVINPVKSVEDFNVPLFSIPHRGAPPITGCVPRPAGGGNRSMYTMECDPDGNAVADLDGGVEWWTEAAEGDGNV